MHSIHLVCGDGDLLGLPGSLVLRRHLKDAVRVDLEGHFDLRYSSGRRREAGQLELAQHVVVLGHRTLSLEHLDEHRGLVVLVGGEGLRLFGRDDGVTADDLRHYSADGLDTLSDINLNAAHKRKGNGTQGRKISKSASKKGDTSHETQHLEVGKSRAKIARVKENFSKTAFSQTCRLLGRLPLRGANTPSAPG